MRLEDAERVVELDQMCFPTPWSLSAYITEISNSSSYYIVAKTDNKVIGFAGEWLIMDEAHITTIGVNPEFRGQKVGERMLVDLLDKAMEQGARRATLEVRRNNQTAQTLYRKYGFRVVAARKAYYSNNNEDALIMWIDNMREAGFLKVYQANKQRLGQGNP